MLAAAPSPSPAAPAAGWPARLHLTLARRAGRTRITGAGHHGPLRIQRAFHPEGDGTAHVVILHPPGGLVGGDRLRVEARVRAGAQGLLTTTGATKVYRTNGRRATQRVTLDVEAGAALEHVPQQTVVFDGADARLTTRANLAEGARFLGWEVVCLGRPACAERFAHGRVRLGLEIWRGERPLLIERGRLAGGSELLEGAFGLGGHAALGTMVATEGDVDAVRAAVAAGAPHVAVTRVSGLVVVRALGADAGRVRRWLERARHAVRDAWRRPRLDPAIWRT
jgi:urease accessory protein